MTPIERMTRVIVMMRLLGANPYWIESARTALLWMENGYWTKISHQHEDIAERWERSWQKHLEGP